MFFKIKVTPEAKHEIVRQVSSDHFEIAVKDKAVHNLANKRSLALLAEHLKVPSVHLRIINGHQSPHKLISFNPPPPRN